MVAMLLIILFISATGSDTIMRPIANTVDCYIVEGSVVKKEIDKCILVCANCHRELHHKERSLLEKSKSE